MVARRPPGAAPASAACTRDRPENTRDRTRRIPDGRADAGGGGGGARGGRRRALAGRLGAPVAVMRDAADEEGRDCARCVV